MKHKNTNSTKSKKKNKSNKQKLQEAVPSSENLYTGNLNFSEKPTEKIDSEDKDLNSENVSAIPQTPDRFRPASVDFWFPRRL